MMFRSFAAATFSATAFDASLEAAQNALGYSRTQESRISADQAAAWDTPGMTGQRVAILQSENGHGTFLRLIESPSGAAAPALKTFGWNAAELHVRDVHGLAEKLQTSAYTIMGGPTDLMNNGAVVAMQICGPSGEMFYLAEINNERMRHVYGHATVSIDRIFMLILGSHNHAETRAFYAPFTNVTKPRRSPLRLLAQTHELDLDTKFEVGAAAFAEQCRIEIDAYPSSAIRREMPAGELPPGLAMASVYVDDIAALAQTFKTNTYQLPGPVYDGGEALLTRGPSGEWLELIERNQKG